MCYAYYDNFERRTKKDSARKPEMHPTEAKVEQEPQAPPRKPPQAEGSPWSFLVRRRRESEVTEPTTERVRQDA
ncbi:hypothetical protein [Arthrobacter sp. efr-133-TYG-104]|uniref:hypothetical protein n=1 Tax=Arthrobacter sp. efr-133-TYG-104 TaxID=3040324 RepID=UPI00255154EB|nr:hypothetical protein [Arthrobacter sp. efr-133-TYG-104]